ncbi:hypothetical protein PM082_009260 [Marasmius tenuissimus]|nr:hypothetical protein PM082_009260 [Marasmius tenuissimus]
MAYAQTHRPAQSVSSNNLLPPGTPDQKRERRMTSPNLGQSSGRPPSPLRNGYVVNTSTGIDPDALDDDEDEDDDDSEDESRGRNINRSPSPASSVSQMAASFAQRMGNLVSGMAPSPSPSLPSDAELEAEAERERDRTRREAERILSREAHERQHVEDRVLAMLESTRGLPPPPVRAQTMPNPPSPSSSQKEKDGPSWWTNAKNKLTPTKELTPAQQVIQEAKTREKEMKKTKGKEREWSSNGQGTIKANDPTLLNLNIPATPQQQPRRPASASPASPTPSRSNMAPNLSPSPLRSGENGNSSPSREAPPLYAHFNAQGTLDAHVTLLTIAKRFEKLEKWTVGHVRALEERMSDVERWLVDKEKEKDDVISSSSLRAPEPNSGAASAEIREVREEIVELQGRIGEIGREMARLAVAPGNLSSNRSRQSAEVTVSSSTHSPSVNHERVTSSAADIIDPDMSFNNTPQPRRVPSVTARQSTSPPMTSSRASTGTKLPYPTGDYASPAETSIAGFFSPTNSPPSSVTKSARPISMNITGLPPPALQQNPPMSSSSSSYSMASFSSTSSISPQTASNNNGMTSPSSSPAAGKPSKALPVPPPHKTSSSSLRQNSASPTPRKRYTVALGGPLVPPEDWEEQQQQPHQEQQQRQRPMTPRSGRQRYTASPANDSERGDDEDGEDEFQDETIGKSKATKVSSGLRSNGLPTPPRVRAQSAYGLSSIQAQSPATMAAMGGDLPSVAPLRPRVRSKSTDRLDAGGGKSSSFVDPLVLRKQESAAKLAMPKPIGKVPVGQLVAFFDQERK